MKPEGPIIRTRELTRTFGDFVAVDRVTFEVDSGEIFGCLGANGAGKTTTIRMLCGLIPPSAGEGYVGGIDVSRDPEAVKRSLGYMSQRFSLYLDLLVVENLEFFGGAYGLGGAHLRRRIDEVLQQVDLDAERRTLTRALPGGMRQRLALASAMLHQPRILFLDEPTAGVDPSARRVFWRLIRQLSREGTTVFVTTHYMDEAEFCHRIGLMVDGRLVALDTPEGLKREHVPGQIFEMDGAQVHRALQLCRTLPGVLDVQPFGAAAHVRVDPGRLSAEQLKAALSGAGLDDLQLRAAQPSLEDVFLAVVEAGSRCRIPERPEGARGPGSRGPIPTERPAGARR